MPVHPQAIKNLVLQIKDAFKLARDEIRETRKAFAGVTGDKGYQDTRKQVLGRDPVVFISPSEIRAVPLDAMFKPPRSNSTVVPSVLCATG